MNGSYFNFPAIQATLNFIKMHQEPNIPSVSLLVKLSLLAPQTTNPQDFRKDGSHFIEGMIAEVDPTSVVITYLLSDDPRLYHYTVSFSSIIYMLSPVITSYFEEYIYSMKANNSLCPPLSNQWTKLLKSFHQELSDRSDTQNIAAYILFDGVMSRPTLPLSAYTVLETLLIIDHYTILPASSLLGYGFIPLCPQPESIYLSKEETPYV